MLDFADRDLEHIMTGPLAEPATFISARGGPAHECRVFFSAPGRDVAPGQSHSPVATAALEIFARLADLPAEPRRDDRFTVRGQEYRVVKPTPDGQGGVTLALHKVTP